jgi:L-seryl-tRNA(Ser) seleniumtransferase
VTAPSLRAIPPVNALLDHIELAETVSRVGRATVLKAVRAATEEVRRQILEGEPAPVDPSSLIRRAQAILERRKPNLRRVLNATGILLHTGLGRAPLAVEAIDAVAEAARGYCNLELDLETGERGQRTSGVAELLAKLAGAESATVVNNNAGATVLVLRALAAGREVVVSRGELIEIGGSFRLPEILEVSGARLREVGTTNRTRLGDYERAIGPETAVLLRVHPSNYRVMGFTESVGIGALAALARARGLRAIDDIGSGALGPGQPPNVSGEPTLLESIAAGADLVLASGDKLLGGPQCGLIVGNRAVVSLVERDPLMRALRVDKMTVAALEATLTLALEPALAARRIPLWAFLDAPLESLKQRAERLAEAFRTELGLIATAVESTAYLGGGSAPCDSIPSAAVEVSPPFPPTGQNERAWARALRLGDPVVVPRIHRGAVLFDLRALEPHEDETLLEAVRRLAGCSAGESAVDVEQ